MKQWDRDVSKVFCKDELTYVEVNDCQGNEGELTRVGFKYFVENFEETREEEGPDVELIRILHKAINC